MADSEDSIQELLKGIGEAADLKGGPAVAVTGLISLFGILNQSIKDTNEELDKLAQNAAQPIGGGIGAFNDAVSNARTNLANLYADLNNAGVDTDAIKTGIDRARELTTVKLEGQKKVIEALLKEEEIRARMDKASPGELVAIQTRGQAEMDQVQRAIDLNKGSSSLVLEQSERAGRKDKIHQENLDAQSAAESAKRKKVENDATIARLLDETGQGKEGANNEIFQQSLSAIQGAGEKVETLTDNKATALRRAGEESAPQEELDRIRTGFDKLIQGAQAEFEKARNALQVKRNKLGQAQAQAQDIDDAAADVVAKAAAKNAADVANEARLRELPDLIDQAQKTESAKFFADDVSNAISRSGTAIVGEKGGQIDVATARAHLEAGQKSAGELVRLAVEAAKTHVELLPQLTSALAAQKAANAEANQRLQQQINQAGKIP